MKFDPKGKALWVFPFLFLGPLLVFAHPGAGPRTPESYVTVPDDSIQASARKDLGKDWRVVETEHFRVFSNSNPRYQKIVAGLIEQFYLQVYPRFFTRPFPRTDVHLGDQRKDFERLVKPISHLDYSRLLGFNHGNKGVYSYHWASKIGPMGLWVLYHEVTHSFIDTEAAGRPVPRWFNEGFACLFENADIVQGKWVYGNPSPARDPIFCALFEAGKLPSLKVFLHLSDEKFATDTNFTYYGIGRSLFLFLLTRKGEPCLKVFTREILAGKDGVKALEAATGEPLAQVEREWKENIRRVDFGAVVRTKAIWFFGPFSVSGAKNSNSLEILRNGAKKFPQYGLLHLSLAEVDRAAGFRVEALKEAQRALKDSRLPIPAAAYRVIGWAYESTDPKKAIEAYQKVIDNQPWSDIVDKNSFQKLADLKLQNGDHKGADLLLKQLDILLMEDKAP